MLKNHTATPVVRGAVAGWLPRVIAKKQEMLINIRYQHHKW